MSNKFKIGDIVYCLQTEMCYGDGPEIVKRTILDFQLKEFYEYKVIIEKGYRGQTHYNEKDICYTLIEARELYNKYYRSFLANTIKKK